MQSITGKPTLRDNYSVKRNGSHHRSSELSASLFFFFFVCVCVCVTGFLVNLLGRKLGPETPSPEKPRSNCSPGLRRLISGRSLPQALLVSDWEAPGESLKGQGKI